MLAALAPAAACDPLSGAACASDANCPDPLVCNETGICAADSTGLGGSITPPTDGSADLPSKGTPPSIDPIDSPGTVEQPPTTVDPPVIDEPTDPTQNPTAECVRFDGNLDLTSDADVALFANEPCFDVAGSVFLSGAITSAQGLSGLAIVDGDMLIEGTSLTSLAGLQSLSRVTGSFVVRGNLQLRAFDTGLTALTQVDKDISFENNIALSICLVRDAVLKIFVGGDAFAFGNANVECAAAD